MPNIKAAMKALRQNKVRTAINKTFMNEIDRLRSQINKSVLAKDVVKAKDIFQSLQQRLDKAAKNNLFTKGSAARVKSTVSKLIAKIK